MTPNIPYYLVGLPSLSVNNRDAMPTVPAVYFVFADPSEVLYVGMTANLRQRWRSHHRLAQVRREGVRIYWLPVDEAFGADNLANLERYCIGKFRPRLNDAPMGWRAERAWLVGIIKRLVADRRRLLAQLAAH